MVMGARYFGRPPRMGTLWFKNENFSFSKFLLISLQTSIANLVLAV